MSMSTHVEGFVPADEEYAKMKAVWDACDSAGIEIPEDVFDFFDEVKPTGLGMRIDLKLEDYRNGEDEGFKLLVSDIPKNVKTILFFNSW